MTIIETQINIRVLKQRTPIAVNVIVRNIVQIWEAQIVREKVRQVGVDPDLNEIHNS